MAKMKYWNGTAWVVLDARNADYATSAWNATNSDAVNGKTFTDIQGDAQTKATTAENNAKTASMSFYNLTTLGNTTNWNTATTIGTYNVAITSTLTSTYNQPVGAYGKGILAVFTNGANTVAQMYMPHNITYNNSLYYRAKNGASDWGYWQVIGAREADMLSISDRDNYFTASNVEDALQEVGNAISGLKTNLLSTINSLLNS